MKNVLIQTVSKDEHAWGPVAQALEARGARPWILLTDRFPMDVGLSWRGRDQAWLEFRAHSQHHPGERLDMGELDAVWARRNGVGRGMPTEIPADVRAGSAREGGGILRGVLLDSDAFWMDPPAIYYRARNKALQLAIARKVGLDVPLTLETNDPVEARAFVEDLGRPVIAKMHTDVRMGDGATIYTNVLKPGDLAALDGLQACPMILQEALPKARELRVACAGEQLFALGLDSEHLEGESEVDWRRTGAQTLHHWRPVDLPEDFAQGLLALHDALGTNYGSADVVVTPDGRHVLLENNAVGESFWFYEHHPFAQALADVLLGLAPRRSSPRELR